MSKIRTDVVIPKQRLKDNKIYFSVKLDDNETILKVREVLEEYIELAVIKKIDEYIFNKSKFINIILYVELGDNHFQKMSSLIYDTIGDVPVRVISYSNSYGVISTCNNPIFSSKSKAGLDKLLKL